MWSVPKETQRGGPASLSSEAVPPAPPEVDKYPAPFLGTANVIASSAPDR